eukprot:128607_1
MANNQYFNHYKLRKESSSLKALIKKYDQIMRANKDYECTVVRVNNYDSHQEQRTRIDRDMKGKYEEAKRYRDKIVEEEKQRKMQQAEQRRQRKKQEEERKRKAEEERKRKKK